MSIPAAFQKTQSSSDFSPVSMSLNISQKVKEMVLNLQKKQGTFLTETMQCIKNQETESCFYGIQSDEQMVKDQDGQENINDTVKRYAEIKAHILQKMGLQPNFPVLQVVGDSAAFSLQGTQKAMKFLQQHLSSHSAIAYGYTGHFGSDGTQCVNAAVSTYIIQNGLVGQTIGNLVGFHTPTALDSWGCSGPTLNHYLLVYGKDESRRETGTVFGDDITTSDFLSDQLIMLEGGIQSFRQACNFLLLERPIIALTGLRGEKTRFALTEDGQSKNYFTAPEFLEFMKNKVKDGKEETTPSDEILNGWYDEYLHTRLLSDPKRGDYDTKKKLLDDAWKLFKGEKLYKKLHLFTCENASTAM